MASGGGTLEAICYVKDLKVLEGITRESAEKSQKICQALFDANLQTSTNDDKDIFCPITYCIFVIPVKTPCNHIFEYEAIQKSLENNNACPLCRTRIELSACALSHKTERAVVTKIKNAMQYLHRITVTPSINYDKREWFLFNKQIELKPGDTYNPDFVKRLAVQAVESNALLENVPSVIEKIKNNKLTELEAYVLSVFLTERIKKYQEKINTIFDNMRRTLNKARDNQEIQIKEYLVQIHKLEAWYNDASIG